MKIKIEITKSEVRRFLYRLLAVILSVFNATFVYLASFKVNTLGISDEIMGPLGVMIAAYLIISAVNNWRFS